MGWREQLINFPARRTCGWGRRFEHGRAKVAIVQIANRVHTMFPTANYITIVAIRGYYGQRRVLVWGFGKTPELVDPNDPDLQTLLKIAGKYADDEETLRALRLFQP